jgi:hypothetical protein
MDVFIGVGRQQPSMRFTLIVNFDFRNIAVSPERSR